MWKIGERAQKRDRCSKCWAGVQRSFQELINSFAEFTSYSWSGSRFTGITGRLCWMEKQVIHLVEEITPGGVLGDTDTHFWVGCTSNITLINLQTCLYTYILSPKRQLILLHLLFRSWKFLGSHVVNTLDIWQFTEILPQEDPRSITWSQRELCTAESSLYLSWFPRNLQLQTLRLC